MGKVTWSILCDASRKLAQPMSRTRVPLWCIYKKPRDKRHKTVGGLSPCRKFKKGGNEKFPSRASLRDATTSWVGLCGVTR